ncbi:hypothetical protein BSKO_05708 [Bryopsis sp. KO-2023]|nr:hypothetical protein BSKO_05708 [Bryopsis sp. KO-2023]
MKTQAAGMSMAAPFAGMRRLPSVAPGGAGGSRVPRISPSGVFRQDVARSKELRPHVVRSAAGKVETTLAELQELTKLDYYQYIEDAGENLVVVDFFTDWCGPCKMMYPQLQQMAEDLKPMGVRFVKFNCNKYNKELGSGLGVRVAPTFFLYKDGVKVADMTGAKVEKLREMVEKYM